MPDRLIREGLKTSRRIGALSERAELLFFRLLLTACPKGRYSYDPALIKQTALTNRPRTRTTDILAALKELERSDLISRYTAPDGSPLFFIPRYNQRLKHARSPFPAPPNGPPDAEGQELMPFTGDPPVDQDQKNERRRESARGAPPTAPESQEVWIERLRAAWPGLNIEQELTMAANDRATTRKKLQRDWFEKYWLPKCSPEVKLGTHGSAPPATIPEPDGWKKLPAYLRSNYAPKGAFECLSWIRLPRDVQEFFVLAIEEERRSA